MLATVIKSVSVLKNPVNIFSMAMLASFFVLLIWVGQSRVEQFTDAHQKIADKATATAANELALLISEKQRLLHIFVEDNLPAIRQLTDKPNDTGLHNKIDNSLRRYFPDFFASSIADRTGQLVIDDFDGEVGDLCISDMQQAIQSGKSQVRVHPHIDQYHIDSMIRFKHRNKDYIFFVSFGLNELAKILQLSSPEHHSLIVTLPGVRELIEITEQGGRDTIKDVPDYFLSDKQQSRVMASSNVEGSRWHVIDLYDEGLFDAYKTNLVREGVNIYLLFLVIVLMMWVIVLKKEHRSASVENKLLLRNQEITMLNDQLRSLSITDELTGLYNRRYMNNRLKEEWSRAKRSHNTLAVALVDLDYFKQYNDRYGHPAGDVCLKKLARLMDHGFRRSGEIVARYGGEEFLIILSDTNQDDAVYLIDNLRRRVEQEKIVHEDSTISDYVTISAGLVYGSPEPEASLDEFIKKADEALYQAKGEGRNRLKVIEFSV
jgi:diguanylate cyclase (GGDEF)-like protein